MSGIEWNFNEISMQCSSEQARNVLIFLLFVLFFGSYCFRLEHSGWIAIQLARENIILAAVGYDIAPKGIGIQE